MRTLGDQARDFREGRGWNTTAMGKAVGTSRQNIESLETSGNRIPKYIGDLAGVLGTTVDDMLYQAGLSKRPPSGPRWPFSKVGIARYLALSEADKGYVEGRLEQAIEVCEARSAPQVKKHSKQFDVAHLAVEQLSDEERLELFTAIQQPGLLDHEVEKRIPATKRRTPADPADVERLRKAATKGKNAPARKSV